MRYGRGEILGYVIAVTVTATVLLSWLLMGSRVSLDPYPLLVIAAASICWYAEARPGLLAGLIAIGAIAFIAPIFSASHGVPGTESRTFSLFVITALTSVSLLRALIRLHKVATYFPGLDRDLISSMADGVCVLDPAGRVRYLNRAGTDMLGWTGAELRGRLLNTAVRSQIPARDTKLRMSASDPSEEAPPVTGSQDGVFTCKDGSQLPVKLTVSPLRRRGEHAGTMLIFCRQTEELATRAEMRTQHFGQLLRNAPDPMWLTDLYGYLLLANERAADVFGYAKPADMVGMSALELFHPDDRRRAVHDKWRAIREGSLSGLVYTGSRNDRTLSLECALSLVADVVEQVTVLTVARVIDDPFDLEREEVPVAVPRWQAVTAEAAAVFGESATILEAIPRLLESICTGAGWDAGIYWAVDPEDGALRCETVWRRTGFYLPGFESLCRQLVCAPGMDLPGRAMERRASLWVEDIVCDPRIPRAFMAAKEGVHASLCVPISTRGEIQGVLEFLSRERRALDQELVEEMRAVSAVSGRFMQLKEAERTLEYQALHDSLTDLPNRKLLQKRIGQAAGAAREYRTHMALLGIDLDRFKQVNDLHGHHVGDLLLQQVGMRLCAALRESDTVARVGGDEFTVLLPRADERAAVTVARKIHTALAHPFLVDGQRLSIGGSIGIAILPEHADEIDDLLHRADVAMYLAKRTGGGYTLYSPEQEVAATSVTRRHRAPSTA